MALRAGIRRDKHLGIGFSVCRPYGSSYANTCPWHSPIDTSRHHPNAYRPLVYLNALFFWWMCRLVPCRGFCTSAMVESNVPTFWHFQGFGGTSLDIYGHNLNNVHRFFHPQNTPKSAQKHGEDALNMVECHQKGRGKPDSTQFLTPPNTDLTPQFWK